MALMPALALALGLLTPPESPAPAAPPPAHGTHLLLGDGRVLEGDIELAGNQYRIRRRLGESFIPTRQVLYLGTGMDDLYRYLRGRLKPNDADGRVKLAHWCQDHGLSAEAVALANEAVRLRPGHPQAVQLLKVMERMAEPAPAVVNGSAGSGAVESAEPPPPARPEEVPPPADCPAEAIGPFIAKVQPLLMNACAGCHASGQGGSFRLVRIYPDGGGNQRAIQVNLAAVFAQLNKTRPEESAFLVKAVTAHGGMPNPPLQDRRAPAFKLLDDWVRLALRAAPTAPSGKPSAMPNPVPPTAPAPGGPPPQIGANRPSAAPVSGVPMTPAAPRRPTPPPTIDPTDPANFNPPTPPKGPPGPGGK